MADRVLYLQPALMTRSLPDPDQQARIRRLQRHLSRLTRRLPRLSRNRYLEANTIVGHYRDELARAQAQEYRTVNDGRFAVWPLDLDAYGRGLVEAGHLDTLAEAENAISENILADLDGLNRDLNTWLLARVLRGRRKAGNPGAVRNDTRVLRDFFRWIRRLQELQERIANESVFGLFEDDSAFPAAAATPADRVWLWLTTAPENVGRGAAETAFLTGMGLDPDTLSPFGTSVRDTPRTGISSRDPRITLSAHEQRLFERPTGDSAAGRKRNHVTAAGATGPAIWREWLAAFPTDIPTDAVKVRAWAAADPERTALRLTSANLDVSEYFVTDALQRDRHRDQQ